MHRKSLAHECHIRDQLPLHIIQHPIIDAHHTVYDIFGLPLEVGARDGEIVGATVGPIELLEEGGVLFVVRGVKLSRRSVEFLDLENDVIKGCNIRID